MKDPRSMRTYATIIMVGIIAGLLLLFAFQSIWVYGGSESAIMLQVGLQQSRAQSIAKDATLIGYVPARDVQAEADLQVILPAWEQSQIGLAQGDARLQLPPRVPSDVAASLSIAEPDYAAIDVAAQVLESHPTDAHKQLEATIILSHINGYAASMSQVELQWQGHIDRGFYMLFLIEAILTILIIAGTLFKYFFLTHRVIHALIQRTKNQGASTP